MKQFTKKQLPIWLSICLAGGAVAPGFATASTPDSANALILEQGVMALNQQTLVEQLIARNAQVLFSQLQTELAQHQILQETGAFEPVFFSNVRYDDVRRQAEASDRSSPRLSPDFSVFEEQRSQYEIGVNSRLRSGADLRVSYQTLHRENNTIGQITSNPSNNAEWTGSINLVITQPLMRGLGATQQQSRIAQAELEHQVLISQYQQQLMRSMFDGLSAYWQLYRVEQVQQMRVESLENAQKTYADLERRVRAGQLPETTLLEARSNILSRQAELDASLHAYQDAKTRLTTLLNISAAEQDVTIKLLDEPVATALALQGSFEAYFDTVLASWPSYAVALKRADVQMEQLKSARDELKPQLDLLMGYSTNGLGFDYGKSAEKQFSTDFPSWFAGLSLTMPLQGNKRARGQELAALTRLSQSEIDAQAIRTGLANDLQNRLIQVERSHDELMGYQDNVALLKELLRIERELFDAGSRRLSDVYDREDRLNRGMQQYIDAKVKFEIAKLSLQLAEGSLLGNFGISVGDGSSLSASPVQPVVQR
ncbi:TolC family protein [Thiomicrospira cyclica]|uniref:Outer membrane efflux protein n=1 Tax=Thiomicrospira cyclica (strain DSM 14477 / JCM 11371 / ALM1) TaxID=717773 RepID=F6DAF8_THICA|nr:TolC family protein [Thiomicrospira cyclica]AEG31124.1 outer membrane efflux protein [Thiomicrospira cyclica ALM1]